MENLSTTDEVLLLSGDILKGGQQDRVVQFDQLVPPKSGKVELSVFCVEHTASRWMKPLTEQDKTFACSPGQICSNRLHWPIAPEGSQSKVWANVRKAQQDLSEKTGTDVKTTESDSSLALSLQVKEVLAATDKYVSKLEPIVKDKADVLGYVFAINGKVYAADIYCSPTLFQKAWPRLIQANAIEAFAEMKKDKAFPAVQLADITAFLEDADKGTASAKDVAADQKQTTKETAKSIRFGTQLKMPAAGGAGPAAALPALELRSNSIAK